MPPWKGRELEESTAKKKKGNKKENKRGASLPLTSLLHEGEKGERGEKMPCGSLYGRGESAIRPEDRGRRRPTSPAPYSFHQFLLAIHMGGKKKKKKKRAHHDF